MTISVRTTTSRSNHKAAPGLVIPLAVLAVLAVLVVLAADVGLGLAGWLAATIYGLVTCAALRVGLHRAGERRLGPANQVTLARAALVAGVVALVADSFDRRVPVAALVALAVVALVLDGVDGQVARQTGTASALGARFDMEVDAFLILVLSVFVARPLGGWVLAIGGMRYCFVVAARVLPWLRAGLPPRFSRKVVAATQGIVLVAASAGVLPRPLTVASVGLALALLAWSFASDIGWLWRHRDRYPVAAGGR